MLPTPKMTTVHLFPFPSCKNNEISDHFHMPTSCLCEKLLFSTFFCTQVQKRGGAFMTLLGSHCLGKGQLHSVSLSSIHCFHHNHFLVLGFSASVIYKLSRTLFILVHDFINLKFCSAFLCCSALLDRYSTEALY